MKYKIGDKVKVKSGTKILSCGAIQDMLQMAGKVVTIKEYCDNDYRIEEFDYYWSDEMFSGLAEQEGKGMKFSKVIAELEKYPSKKFETHLQNGTKVVAYSSGYVDSYFHIDFFDQDNKKISEERAVGKFNGNIRTALCWHEVKPEPVAVPFLEAVKALSEGIPVYNILDDSKTIYTETYLQDSGGYAISASEILNGKWYIVD